MKHAGSEPRSARAKLSGAAVGRRFCLFLAHNAGGTAITFALGLPVMAGAVGIAVDYSTFINQRQKLQTAADAAALAATAELSVAVPVEQRAKAVAETIVRARIPPSSTETPVKVSVTLPPDRSSIRVLVEQQKQAIMNRIVTPTLTDLAVAATARLTGSRKICVIGLDPNKDGTVSLDASAKLTANGCAVHSNSVTSKGVSSKSAAMITAALICSSGGFEGSGYSGQKMTDCPAMADPLAGRPPPSLGTLRSSKKLVIDKTPVKPLDPGLYVEGIEVKGTSTVVTLNPGVYVIKSGVLKVDDTATLKGKGVGFYFADKDSHFDFLSSARIDLSAPTGTGGSGDEQAMAGLLFFGNRDADDFKQYKITSNFANNLIGTIYLPKGYFTIDAKQAVADKSAYTAVIVRRLELKDAPNLVLNTNYHLTDVPVPDGLAPTGARLSQ